MKVKQNIPNYFLYRHIRPDTNEVFYVGKGNNLDKRLKTFRRAFLRSQRTKYWNNVVNKNKGIFKVDILFECDTEKEANVKEIEFISLYGRKDLRLGTLVNMSDGGEGVSGVVFSKEAIAKRSGINHYNFNRVMTQKTKDKISKSNKGIIRTEDFKNKIKSTLLKKEKIKIINTDTKEIYYGVIHAAKENGITSKNLYRYLTNIRPNKTPLCYYKDYITGNYIINQHPKSRGCKKYVIDTETGVFYDSIRDAANYTRYAEVTIRKMISNRMVNRTNLKYA